MDTERQEDTIDLLEIFEILRQQAWIIVLTTFLAAAVGFCATYFFATPKYQASAQMIVNSHTDASGEYISNDQITSSVKLAETCRIIIRSHKVLQQVINNLDLDIEYDTLASMVSVEAVNNTQNLKITVTSSDLTLAAAVCRQITEIAPDEIKNAIEAGSVNIWDDIVADPDPVSPHIKRDTVIMALLGAVASIGLIIVVHLFDNKINTEADVTKYLGLTVIGVIPYYEEEKK